MPEQAHWNIFPLGYLLKVKPLKNFHVHVHVLHELDRLSQPKGWALMDCYVRMCTFHLSCSFQVDKLNAELLSVRASYDRLLESERAKHDRLMKEMRERHGEEINQVRERYEEKVTNLQSEVERLQKGSAEVCITARKRVGKFCSKNLFKHFLFKGLTG